MAEKLRRYTQRTIWRRFKWEWRAAVVLIVGAVLYYLYWPVDEPGTVLTNAGGQAVAPPDTLRRSVTNKLAAGDIEFSRIVRERTVGRNGVVEVDFHILPDSLIFRIPNLHSVDLTFTRMSGVSEVLEQTSEGLGAEYQDVTWVGDIAEGDTLRVSLRPKEHIDLSHDLSNYNLSWIRVLVR